MYLCNQHLGHKVNISSTAGAWQEATNTPLLVPCVCDPLLSQGLAIGKAVMFSGCFLMPPIAYRVFFLEFQNNATSSLQPTAQHVPGIIWQIRRIQICFPRLFDTHSILQKARPVLSENSFSEYLWI